MTAQKPHFPPRSFDDLQALKEERARAASVLNAAITEYDLIFAEKMLRETILEAYDRRQKETRTQLETAITDLLPYIASLASRRARAERGEGADTPQPKNDPLQVHFQDFKDRLAMIVLLTGNDPAVTDLTFELTSRAGRVLDAVKHAELVRDARESVDTELEWHATRTQRR